MTKTVNAWFMFENHTFAKLSGTPDEMADTLLMCMARDKFCGLVAVRELEDGPKMKNLSFHGDYKNPENTIKRVIEWRKQLSEMGAVGVPKTQAIAAN